ncbi:response regulator [Comamonas piscis]|uniref:Response regulator n=1 Tax=Comamonas piscis TaxID=1562974 RepID=A0A7G5EK55_9BURK|nr:response regulator [Comamonas piscis]QMV74380.1 response regulator [Comamonas piscis]WSO32829.1 response regulator [Comamonas piscis]
MRIVYIEDNDELRETIGCLMEGPGRSITSCASAEDALLLDAQAPFDLVVSDVSLPGQSGTDLAQALLKQSPQRWIVLCSGYDLGHYPAQWGPNVRTLLKPFEIEELEALLSQIEAQRANASLQ